MRARLIFNGLHLDQAAEDRAGSLSAMRTHLEQLSGGAQDSEELAAWTIRMRDLIDKAASPSSL